MCFPLFSLSVNALTADGTKHAKMDATTAEGRDPREASSVGVGKLREEANLTARVLRDKKRAKVKKTQNFLLATASKADRTAIFVFF